MNGKSSLVEHWSSACTIWDTLASGGLDSTVSGSVDLIGSPSVFRWSKVDADQSIRARADQTGRVNSTLGELAQMERSAWVDHTESESGDSAISQGGRVWTEEEPLFRCALASQHSGRRRASKWLTLRTDPGGTVSGEFPALG